MCVRQLRRNFRLFFMSLLPIVLILLSGFQNVLALNKKESIKYFLEHFESSRSTYLPANKTKVRTLIQEKLKEQGFKTSFQAVPVGQDSYNVIGRIDGSFVNTAEDRIFIVGAHYDTYQDSPGVDDNGSGLAALLQVARQFNDPDQDCQRNYTLILVAFDQKECQSCNNEDRFQCICSYGSATFIKDLTGYLGVSNEKGKIEGAVILDGIMNFDSSYDSQNFTELENHVDDSVRSTVSEIQRNNNRGDFLLAVGRTVKEDYLFDNITKYFRESQYHRGEFKLRNFKLDFQQRPSTLNSVARDNYRYFFDSDHYSFWNNDPPIKALYLTDTLDFRGYMKYCYHNECDNLSHATSDRLHFLTNTADAVAMTALEDTGLVECIPRTFGNVSEVYTSDSGEFQSPGYPTKYPNKADSIWTITVSSGHVVDLWFTEFDLEANECKSDFVDVWNDYDATSLIGRYCGKIAASKIHLKSKGRTMQIHFRSDDFITSKGFKAKWKASKDWKNVTIKGDNSTISFPSYPSEYPNGIECSWLKEISSSSGYQSLQFEDFNLEESASCANDFLEVSAGNTIDNMRVIDKYCGSTKPSTIRVPHKIVKVRFVTDALVSKKEFRITWTTPPQKPNSSSTAGKGVLCLSALLAVLIHVLI